MEIKTLFELQFTSCLIKDVNSFDSNAAVWQTLCLSTSEDKLLEFSHSLELVDNFKANLSFSTLNDDFIAVYFYRVVPSSQKLLVL